MKEKNKLALKAAILTMSLVQLGTNGIGPILAQIAEAFPGTSDTTVQFLMTFPILFTMIFEIAAAFLAEKLPKKILTISGLSIVGVGGLLSFFLHTSLPLLFVWAGVIGIGLGMVAPVAPALINEKFTGGEKQTMLGWQNSASTIGSMLMTFACGFLAAAGWQYGYLVYLIGIPGILCALIGLPSGKISPEKGKEDKVPRQSFRLVIWREMIVAALFLMLYSAIPANISMLVAERGVGDSSVAGVITTLFSLAGMLVGLIFGLLSRVLRQFTNTVGVLMLAAGSVLMGTSDSLIMMIIGSMIAGTSMSMIMPVCMGAASRLKGYEILNAALIMASTSVGIFITPLLTTLTAIITGSSAVSTRFLAFGVIGVVLAVITILLRMGKTTGNEQSE